ncbi:unnamed protein product [Amoebophrya sp. A120]|nr:unnamed protein product [Amoebophrya sp. A120]|eukprot:GSA120T00016743001.1
MASASLLPGAAKFPGTSKVAEPTARDATCPMSSRRSCHTLWMCHCSRVPPFHSFFALPPLHQGARFERLPHVDFNVAPSTELDTFIGQHENGEDWSAARQ